MRILFLLVTAVFVVGCDSIPRRVSERFARVQPQERVFEARESEVFGAAQEALERLGYRVTRTGEAQGLIEGQTRRLPTQQFGASQQYQIEVRLRSVDPGVTTAAAVLREQKEGDFAAGASGLTLREHGRYEMFFETLDELLREQDQGRDAVTDPR